MPPANLPAPRVILASASPRRAQLLREAGYDPIVRPAAIDETTCPDGLLPTEIARHLSMIKAAAVAPEFPDDAVLGADTVVAFGDRCLGKPADAIEARRMLSLLSGTTHMVITGLTVIRQVTGFQRTRHAISAVRMRKLTLHEIQEYLSSGAWAGKAGAYGIQDPDPFVTRVSGSHSNVVGLPIELAIEMLGEAGVARPDGKQAS